MFIDFKKALQEHFASIQNGPGLGRKATLLYANIDRDQIWEQYLNGFTTPELRQDSDCNCCKSFLRQYGGIMYIDKDYSIHSIWERLVVPAEYQNSVNNLAAYCASLPVDSYFGTKEIHAGTDYNYSEKYSCTFNHLYLNMKTVRYSGHDSIESMLGDKNTTAQVFLRSLTELKIEAVETILELIASKSLYRGEEYKTQLEKFQTELVFFNTLKPHQQVGYAFENAIGNFVARIRSSALGTLLIDLSEDMDLEKAVQRWERIMAPANYKRPTALVTPKMFDKAKEELINLGLYDGLYRRYATEADLNINDILFTGVPAVTSEADVFAEAGRDAITNPKTLGTVPTIGIEDFLKNVLPTATTISVLPENQHLGNFVSLITAKNDPHAKLFKWVNPFSWAYTGDIADSMKERVKAAGGKIDAPVRFSIQWNEDGKSIVDLDAHVFEPTGEHINFSTFRGSGNFTRNTGNLDVDMRSPSDVGVENITWRDTSRMADGVYQLKIHNYSNHLRFSGVQAEVEINGVVHSFYHKGAFTGTITVAYLRKVGNEIFVEGKLSGGVSNVESKDKWGVKTYTWTPVSAITLSPNYWDETPTGNKHYMFMLQDCVSDEATRPFFNEFLDNALTPHRKAMEIVSGRLKLEPTTQQLSGLGFSSTNKAELYVLVVSKRTKRVMKVIF